MFQNDKDIVQQLALVLKWFLHQFLNKNNCEFWAHLKRVFWELFLYGKIKDFITR